MGGIGGISPSAVSTGDEGGSILQELDSPQNGFTAAEPPRSIVSLLTKTDLASVDERQAEGRSKTSRSDHLG